MYLTDLSSDINFVKMGRVEVIVVMDLGMYLISISQWWEKPEFALILKNYSKNKWRQKILLLPPARSSRKSIQNFAKTIKFLFLLAGWLASHFLSIAMHSIEFIERERKKWINHGSRSFKSSSLTVLFYRYGQMLYKVIM